MSTLKGGEYLQRAIDFLIEADALKDAAYKAEATIDCLAGIGWAMVAIATRIDNLNSQLDDIADAFPMEFPDKIWPTEK